MIFYVEDADVGKRLDALLASACDISRSAAVKAIEEGRVLVSGELREKKYTPKAGECIEYTEPIPEKYEAEAENIPLDIVYEDDDIAVINKPKGMVVHPAPGNLTGTLVNALLYHCGGSLSGIGGVMRPGIVHRIDKDTSGLLVIAKNDFAHRALSAELEHHGIEREYLALVSGGFREQSGRIDLPIGRHPTDRKKMAVLLSPTAHAKEAVTNYELIRSYSPPGEKISYLRLRLETGRTHQIRVHMSHLGHAILGDTVYGGGSRPFEKQHAKLFSGQTLHAGRLMLTHPRSGERMEFSAPLPEYFMKLLTILDATY